MQLGVEVPRPSINVLMFWINVGFWENAHLLLPYAKINTYLSFRAKCWLWGGVGGQFARNLN